MTEDADRILALLAEVAEAARNVPLPHQPPRLQNALVALSHAESHLLHVLVERWGYDAGASSS